MDATSICDLHSTLVTEKAPLTGRWETVRNYFLPEHGSVYGYRTTGERRRFGINDIGIEAVRDLASGLYSNTMSLSTQWFTLRSGDPQLANQSKVKNILTKSAKKLHKAFQNSNLTAQAQKYFVYLVTFGTGILYSEFINGRLNFRAYSPADLVFTVDPQEKVNSVIREFRYTAKQAAQEFGEDNLSEKIRKCASDPKKQNERFDFLHAVMPRDGDYNPDSLGTKNMPFASYFLEKGEKKIIRESGYRSMPYHIARFYHEDDSPWGISAAMTMTGTAQMIEDMEGDLNRLIQKTVDPPMIADDEEAVNGKAISQEPGSLSFWRAKRDGSGAAPFQMIPQGRPEYGLSLLERYEKRVKDAFFVDLFLDEIQKPNTTATEVIQRKEERTLRIAPVISRQQSEQYTPLIERCFYLLIENGIITEIPSDMWGMEYEVFYTSRLDSQIRRVEMQNTVQAFQEVAQVSGIAAENPAIAEVVDMDVLVRRIMESYNVDPDIVHTEQETKKIRERIAQQRQAQLEREDRAEASNLVKPVDLQGENPEAAIEMIAGAA